PFVFQGVDMSAKEDLIEGLNGDLNRELEAVLRYIYHVSSATSLLGHELRELLKKDVAGELGHAMFLADKIVALGGHVKIQPTMPKKAKSAKEMLTEDVALERKVLASYAERIQQAEAFGDRGLVNRLEDILAEETDHAEELERLAR